MEIKKLKEIGFSDREIGESHLSPIRLYENRYFHQNTPIDYRKVAIMTCVEKRINFENTCNNTWNMMSMFLVVKCPKCKRNMKEGNGYGNSDKNTRNYECEKCKIEASLTLHGGDFEYKFKKEVDKNDM